MQASDIAVGILLFIVIFLVNRWDKVFVKWIWNILGRVRKKRVQKEGCSKRSRTSRLGEELFRAKRRSNGIPCLPEILSRVSTILYGQSSRTPGFSLRVDSPPLSSLTKIWLVSRFLKSSCLKIEKRRLVAFFRQLTYHSHTYP